MNVMNIYLIENDASNCWDDDPSRWLVYAKDKPQALCISPDDRGTSMYREVRCTLLGTSFEEPEAGLILASFD